MQDMVSWLASVSVQVVLNYGSSQIIYLIFVLLIFILFNLDVFFVLTNKCSIWRK